jgi:tRNA(fMet)-specific endonuclease VapC
VKKLEAHGHESAIAAPVWSELTFSWQRLPKGRLRDAIEAYLEAVVRATFPVLSYDEAAAHWHASNALAWKPWASRRRTWMARLRPSPASTI